MISRLVSIAALCVVVYSTPIRDVELDFLERQAIEPTAVAPASVQPPSNFTVPAPSASGSVTPEPSPSPTTTLTATPSTTSTPSATMTPSMTSSPSPTASMTMSASPSMTMTPTISPTPSVTTSPGSSTTPTASVTPTISNSPPPSVTPSISPSISMTASGSPAPSQTSSPSPTLSTGALPFALETTPLPEATTAPRPPCFPATATVELEDGTLKKMGDLSVGDRVAVGGGKYSEVFMFTHKLADVKQDFVRIVTEAGPALRLTAGHYLPVNGRYQPAKVAAVGDFVELATGQSTRISAISTVQDTGLFNPQTTHGDVVVDGVRCSTYTTAVPRDLAHAALAPMRAVCQRLGLYFSFLESGADTVARFTSTLA